MSDRQEVIVIGAGLSGLSSGIYAALNGYRVRIFEHANQAGGVTATWKRKGFVIDGGMHFFMNCFPGSPAHHLYQELGAALEGMYRPLATYSRYVDRRTGRTLEVTPDLDRLARDLKSLADPLPTKDGKFIEAFIQGAKQVGRRDLFLAMAKPGEMTGLWDRIRMVMAAGLAGRYMTGPWARPMTEAVAGLADPWLKEIFCRFFMPEVPVWFTMLMLGSLAQGSMGLCRSGSAGFFRALEERFKGLGGEINYKSTVKKILVEQDRAVGIELKDGSIHRAGAIISAADGHSTIFDLLGGGYVDKKIKTRYREWKLFEPIVLLNYGVDRLFDDEPWNVDIRPKEPVKSDLISDQWFNVRLFNYGPGFAPEGKTVVQVMAGGPWDRWRELKEDPEQYKEAKAALAGLYADKLEEQWPGVKDRIEMVDVATPYTTWRYTFNHHGAWEGFLPTPEQIHQVIPRTLPGLSRFLMAGQWVMPGGGVISCIQSGRHAAMLLCREDGKKFTARVG